jgi:DNA-binding NarL/FixJ family response regulator
MAVVAQASTGEEALELFLKLEPDVLILDLQMPGEGGMSRRRDRRAPKRVDQDVVRTRKNAP